MELKSGERVGFDVTAAEARVGMPKGLKSLEKFPQGMVSTLIAEHSRLQSDDATLERLLSFVATPWWEARRPLKREIAAIERDPGIGPVAKKLFERNVAKSKLKKKQKTYSVFQNARKVRAQVDKDQWGHSTDTELLEYKQEYMDILDKPTGVVRQTDTYKVASELVDLIEKVILARQSGILAPSLVRQRTEPEVKREKKRAKKEGVQRRGFLMNFTGLVLEG